MGYVGALCAFDYQLALVVLSFVVVDKNKQVRRSVDRLANSSILPIPYEFVGIDFGSQEYRSMCRGFAIPLVHLLLLAALYASFL